MTYIIYTTEGIILKRNTIGEADLNLYILTRDLGLILADAKSARVAKSKLRSGLQEYSYGTFSTVHGKNGWKVTNVKSDGNFFFENEEYFRVILGRVGATLIKTITGEFPQKEIYELVKSGFLALKNLKEDDLPNFEILIILRILFELGYVAKDNVSSSYLDHLNDWGMEILEKVSKHKSSLVHLVNKAFKESQL